MKLEDIFSFRIIDPDSRCLQSSLEYTLMKIRERENNFIETIQNEQSSYSSIDIREKKLCNKHNYKEVIKKDNLL